VKTRIGGYRPDSEGDWVAELECGHTQHVRHRPPWQLRPWVTTPEGRESRLHTPIDCPLCDREERAPPPAADTHDYDTTRRSWNLATRNHNSHKGDQAAALRSGTELLFPEELELLGALDGRSLVHLQCNAGQDSLCLARRGARVLGVDFSDEAIGFARKLSADTGIPAEFECAEVVDWLRTTPSRFELVFSSYGTVGWLPDLGAWARGVARILEPGARFVYVEFHPILWSIAPDLRVTADDYFQVEPFHDPVRDYVAASATNLGAAPGATPRENDVVATSYQYGLAQIVNALLDAGLSLETLREYPHANGCRVHEALVPAPGRRWLWPQGTARTPLMFALSARRA
jgi:SAM-dependent methyltransferase